MIQDQDVKTVNGEGTAAAPAPAEAPSASALPYAAWLKQWWFVAVAVALVYAGTVVDLVKDWWRNDDYSHGFLIPFAVAYFLYRKKHVFAALKPSPSAVGLLVVLVSQAIFLVGYLGAEFFLQRFSLLILAAGVVLFVAGWRWLGEITFSLLLMLLAIPLPTIVFNALAFPLQLLASSWAEVFLRFCSVPVYREGNILQLATQTLNVAEACSGIRSLVSLVTLGTILAYFLPYRWWVRTLFVLTTIPIALAANAFRVGVTGVLAQQYGEKAAEGFFHLFSGWVVFVIAFGILLGVSSLLQKVLKNRFRSEVSL